MSTIEEDPIIGKFFDSPEKKARWIARFRLIYIIWILFLVIGFFLFFLWYIFS